MAEYFNRITDEVQLAANELKSLFSDGGDASGSNTGKKPDFDASGGDSGSYSHEFDLSEIDLDNLSEEEIQQLLAEEMMQNNPLQGIAEGVTKDILSGQVRPKHPKTRGQPCWDIQHI